VGGPQLSARELGNVLAEAGCVRAMELDINAQWVTFASFSWDPATSTVLGTKLNDAMSQAPSRFLAPYGRDFFSLFARF
jgi:hypothetical protein